MYIKGVAILERLAAVAGAAGLTIWLQIFAIYGFGEDTRTGSFTYAARATEQKRLRQLIILNGVF